MKILRFEFQQHIKYGLLQGDKIQSLGGDPFGTLHPERSLNLAEVKLLPPCNPTKIIGIGLNYQEHIKEMGLPISEEPLLFLKPPSALNGPGQAIVLPKAVGAIEYEGELAVVIGKTARFLKEGEALQAILGYTCCNDVTARELQRRDTQFSRAKAFDTFACLGPWIETELDPSRLKLETRVNGVVKQSANTSQMRFSVARLVSFVSEIMTLFPGDVITTGTPSGVGPLKPGDLVEVAIEGIGTLTNPVVGG